MKKVTSILLAAFFGLAMFAGAMPAPAAAQMAIGVRIGPPPPPRYEAIPPAPGPYYRWDRGHWRWNGSRWVWVGGHYVRGRRGGVWVPGYYRQGHGGARVWVQGYWR